MTSAIKILDAHTVNQIAAGEVIERPASALKELLENSADAGARCIEIDFDEGGKKELRVTDDGAGLAPSDLRLALAAHATSKLQTIDDLTSLKTFGFRGEALASLAAVSELTVHSGLRDASAGAKIVSQGGVIGSVVPAPPLRGTQVTVKDLFFNVPARRKFLKSDAGETSAIKKIVRGFGLAHPEITLTARQAGKVVLHWEKEDFFGRASRILDLDKGKALHIRREDRHLKLESVVGMPEAHLPTQAGLWIFVQGRPVTDRSLQQAILEGYRNLLMTHQYPRAVISLRVHPGEVDVNVHPTKSQVKFADPSTAFRFVSHALKEELEKHFAARMNDFAGDAKNGDANLYDGQSDLPLSLIQDVATQYGTRSWSVGASVPMPASANAARVDRRLGPWSSLQVIGQAANTYVVCQSAKSVTLIDQHAAHERVLFERLKRQFQNNSVERQAALIEELIELPRESLETLIDPKFENVFTRLGFEIAARGPTTLAVSVRPAFLLDVSLKPLFERVAEQLGEMGGSVLLDDLVTDIWATLSCHGAIRAGRILASHEMTALLEQMDEFAFSSFCPHGRPVSVQWTLRDLDKLFKRIV